MASLKVTLRRVHRYIALALAVLWISQALTGLAMVFRWEASDALLPGPAMAFDVAALGERIASIDNGPTGQKVSKPLPRVNCTSFFCKSRAVTSLAIV